VGFKLILLRQGQGQGQGQLNTGFQNAS